MAGLYTSSFTTQNGTLLISHDQGNTFTQVPMSFKAGGNMPARNMGERLAIDPNNNSKLFFAARSGNGLWESRTGSSGKATQTIYVGVAQPDGPNLR